MTTTPFSSSSTAAPSRRRPLSVGCAWAAAGCLVIPAAADTAFHLLTPVTSDSTVTAVAQASARPGLAQLAVLLQFGLPVLALGVAVLAWRASAAAPRLAVTAGLVLGCAFLFAPLGVVTDLLPAVVPHLTGAAAAAQVENGYGHTITGHAAMVVLVGQAAGWVLMAVALWRSRMVPRWLATAFGLTFPLQVLTHSATSDRVPAISWGWFTVVLFLCGMYLVRVARAERAAGLDALAWSTGPRHETMAQ